jgi:hypothetical protein
VGLSSRHLLDNNPAPEWLSHTTKGTFFLKADCQVWREWTQQMVYNCAMKQVKKWVGVRRIVPASLDDYLRTFVGAKRERLAVACNRSIVTGQLPFNITGFVKADKYSLADALSKAPRMIQFRGPATNAALARVMGPAEHTLLGGPGMGPTQLPDCSKGMNSDTIASVWDAKRHAIPDAVCLLGDYSKFDAHVHTHVLKLEHEVWRTVSGLKMKLLDKQLINNGTAMGMRYRAVGTRMSGDRNTGGGNSVINILIFRTIKEITGIDLEVLCDGDDSIVWCRKSDLATLTDCCNTIIPRVFGMKWTYSVARSRAEEEYCHRALSYDGVTPRLIADPTRTLERACWVVNSAGKRRNAKIFIGNMISLYLMFPRCPVISKATFTILMRVGAVDSHGLLTRKFILGDGNSYLREWALTHIEPHRVGNKILLPLDFLDVSDDSRYDMSAAFNITAARQEQIERNFAHGQFNPELNFSAGDIVVSAYEETLTRARTELIWSNDHTTPEYS